MKYAFIADHQQEFPVIRPMPAYWVYQKVGIMLGANENQVSENKKMSF